MKLKIIIILMVISISIAAQDKWKDKDVKSRVGKTSAITDRAGGTHNASNIGLFFENRGKLYPRRVTQGPSGEFPINSGKHYIYRIAPYVGVPNNVIQARYTSNEEWEAAAGYHNSELSQIAFSDNPKTWHPENGWPVKDASGNPIILSDQDSYAVFNDSNSTRPILGIEVHQVGYTYGISFARNIIFFKYMIINKGNNDQDSLYFGMYTDIDVGNISGGVPEYGDDFIDYDKENNFLYFYDDGISTEWPDDKTGQFGITFLSTPETDNGKSGVTDMHYFLYYDDEDKDFDTLQYGIMASSPSLYNSPIGDKYFHLGGNTELNYDDPSTIPSGGDDLAAMVSSGPYTLNVGDTLVFYTAIVAGETNEEIYESLSNAYRVFDLNFELSKPPATPILGGVSGDSKATLFWDDKAESSIDNFSNEMDFEGYRLYRSNDNGVTWNMLADYNINSSAGLQYSYIDDKVTNGFEYWYSITAYDRGDTAITSLESPKGNSTDAINLISLTPNSAAAGYEPVSSTEVEHVGTGNSNYVLNVEPVDLNELAGNQYEIQFDYIGKVEKGNATTIVQPVIKDSNLTNMTSYGFAFINNRTYELINLNTDEIIEPTPRSYVAGRTYNLNDGLAVQLTDTSHTASLRPEKGDFITVRFGVKTIKNDIDTVIYPRRIVVGQKQATSDGVIFSLAEPEIIKDVSRVGGTDHFEVSFEVDDISLIEDAVYFVSVDGTGTDAEGNNFISILVRDDSLNNITKFDTVYNLQRIYFKGLSAQIEFDSGKLPSTGNVFSVRTIIPIEPNLTDSFKFSIKGSHVDSQRMIQEINDIKVVPNPYIVSSLYEQEFGELRREPLRQIQFINLPVECTIHIFTIDADLVKTIHHNTNSGTAIWDLRTEAGREIASGVYIYVVKGDNFEFRNRFAVIK